MEYYADDLKFSFAVGCITDADGRFVSDRRSSTYLSYLRWCEENLEDGDFRIVWDNTPDIRIWYRILFRHAEDLLVFKLANSY